MAPIAVTPDSSNASPNGDRLHGYFSSGDSEASSNLHANGFPNGHTNGRSNGHTNGYSNGHFNGDDHTNGFSNGTSDRHGNGVNGHTHGGHSNDHTPDSNTSGYASKKAMPIAIIGMACRLPGNVSTPAEFWELCTRARTGWTEIPKERFNSDVFHHPNPGKGGCLNPVGGNFLNVDLAAFDAPFFGLTEKEAISMDPQQRLLLECTFEALENAGIPKHTIVGKDVGVFVGGSFPEYESHLFRDSDTIPMHQATGCAYAMQSNRISHFFDLRGPSFTADTACSSSLVALHLACQSLRTGESTSALVGGCHLNMLPEFWISFSTCRLLSDNGRSISFDERGTGFGRGEGCGMIVLKPLDQALRDNDPIRAVISGTGINQDGKTPGITMPNGAAQEALMEQVYRNAGLNPAECGFVEAHGTGTRVGDPIEATAIHNVLGQGRTPRDPLWIGSVKSNIGHLEGASGIVAIIKAALMLERGFILPNYDFKQPNTKIPWKEWNLKVPTGQRPWPRGKKYVSVNNFGFGGTNGHIVLEASPFRGQKAPISGDESPESTAGQGRKLYVLTANDKTALSQMMKNIVIYLEQRPEIFQMDLMSNIAYTLGQRRSLLQWRIAIAAQNSFDLIEALNGGKCTPGKEIEPLRIGFIFTGQGAQWHAMGRELYEQYPVFRRSLDFADKCLTALGAEWSLIDELSKDAKSSMVSEAHLSQPSCTAVQLALVDLFRTWGIQPTAVTGHSSGEIGAAYAAGIITFESAMAVAYHRGRLIPILKQKFPHLQGRMMAVGGTKEDVAPLIDAIKEKEVRIACFNSPSSLTISGDEPALAELERVVEGKQMFNRRLVVDVAYHSHHMNLVAKEYRASIAKLAAPTPTGVRFHSSLYGHLIDGTELQPNYWVDNLTCPVRFSEALQSMLEPVGDHKTGVNMLIELGPHSALQGPIKQILKAVGGPAAKISYASALVRKKDAVESAMDVAASLFTKGATLEFSAINFPKSTKAPTLLTDLPRYPWNYSSRYWQESRMTQMHKHRTAPRNDIIGTLANYSNDLEPTWRNIVRLDDLPWLQHHKIQSLIVFPMSGFVAMALEAASQREASKDVHFDAFDLKNVSIIKPLVISDKDIEMTITLRPHQESTLVSSDFWDEFRICSWSHDKAWTEHCIGLISTATKDLENFNQETESRDSEDLARATIACISQGHATSVSSSDMYNSLAEIGVAYGPTFQGINNCHAVDNCSLGDISVPDIAKDMPSHHMTDSILHPAFLESLIEMYWPIIGAGRTSVETIYLPSSIQQMSVSRSTALLAKEAGSTFRAYCKADISRTQPKPSLVDVIATCGSNSYDALISIRGLTVSPILDGVTQLETNVTRELCYKLEWDPVLEPLTEKPTAAGSSNGKLGLHGAAQLPSETEVVIIHEDSNFQQLVAHGVANSLERTTGRLPEVGSLYEVNVAGKILVFLGELHRPFLATLSPTEFSALQKILTAVQGVLWVVRGAYARSANPEANMVTGLSRTIRSETALKFATLDLDAEFPLSEDDTSKAILKVFAAAFGSGSSATSELEFMERQGAFFTPRIVHDHEMNEFVNKQTNPSTLEPTPFADRGRHMRMDITTPGALDTIHFVDDTASEEPLAANEVEIEIKAIGLNYRDAMAARGQVPIGEAGIEASGVVVSIGSGVTNFRVGDRVAALTEGAFATTTRTASSKVFKIPSEMTFEAAATLPLAYCTAYYSLVELGRLADGESILIHGAAGAVGQAAICLAQMAGAEVFATVSNAEKKELLMHEFGLPSDHIFYSRSTSFGNAVVKATDGKGVDVILNSLAGEFLRESWSCLSKFGRFIDIGKRDLTVKSRIEMSHVDNNASFISVDLLALAAERPKVMKRLVCDVGQLLKYGKIRPIHPVTVFPMSDVDTVFKSLHSSRIQGKFVIVPQKNDIVMATPSKKANKLLRPDATYILVGGTGGLGRSMARWMVEKGARHILLVSRSASVTGKVKDLVDELAAMGASVVVRRCNVASRSEVDSLVKIQLEGLPPVRGVVHGTMVLRDVLYEKMTWDDYNQVIAGKVQGGWNFHHALASTPLDFFIAISSAAGAVGNRGQAAYSAANCFLNALVQHRLSLGLPASSLDLTAVSDAGYLADDLDKAAEVARNLGSDTICEAEVLALLAAAINGKMATTCNSHTITGMRITATMRPFWTEDAKFQAMRLAAEEAAAMDASANTVISFNAALKASKSLAEAEEVVCKGLVDKISTVLMLDAEDMDVTRSLSHYPLDSLVAIEIRNFITREFEANLQVLELLSSGSIQTLAKGVCSKSKLVSFST
ncbi:putative polyketide synthase [Coniochaeta ligniaria NRRL 30616]|uniref:Putative polyketide synthase n=1 Tax=Coniochaeta ligniaria NRRL 30616 TaxID=1408157 RepID=A0A1J7IB84_9PEZI|nr:putative polyketide synthase [Coniochaeta ligniaria NRRL 30616]